MRERIFTVFTRLFAVGAIASWLAVVLRTAHLCSSVGVGRLRDFEAVLAPAQRILETAGLSPVESLHWLEWAHQPYELSSTAELASYAALALSGHLMGVALLAFLAALPVAWAAGVAARRGLVLASVCGGAGRVISRRLGPCSAAVSIAAIASIPLLGVIAGLAAPERKHPAAAASQPNVLFISVDTLRADHIHSYGYARPTTPHIDRLAREGALFQSVVSSSSWTLPTHVTMLTGLPPVVHGVVQPKGVRLAPGVITLPERLWSSGYETAAFVAGGYVDAEYGHLQGFEHYDDYSVPAMCQHERAGYRDCATSPKLVGLAERHLEAWDAEGRQRPFFVFLHLWDVHNDYVPPAPYDTMFVTGEPPDFNVGDILDEQVDPGSIIPARRDHLIGLYDGEIRSTDAWIGRLVDRLERLSVLDDTIVLVTSDHGEELGEHQAWGHHRALYDESVLVPLVMRYPPKIPAGTVVTHQASLADVVPTLLSLLEMDAPARSHATTHGLPNGSRDLTPLLRGDTRDWQTVPAFSELHGHLVSIRTPRWKLILDEEDAGVLMLYDLLADPDEEENLASRRPDVVARLSAQIRRWRSQAEPDARHSNRLVQREEQLERLRQLGYIE